MASVDDTTTPCQAQDADKSQPFPDPIPGIIPFGSLTVFAGAPGVGKTAMLAEWCVRWRDGRTICQKATNKPTAFYYFAADRQWKSHQEWFDAAGFPDILHYSLADDHSFDLNRFKFVQKVGDLFEDMLNQLNPIPGSHVLVDPASPLFIAGESNKSRDVAITLLRFSRICKERGINITCVAHFGKQKLDPNDQYARPQDRIAGSHAFSGYSDTQIYMIDPNPPTQPYHLLGWVPRHSPPEDFRFKRAMNGLFVPFELFEELDRREAVLLCVPEEPLAVPAIIARIKEKCGLAEAQAQRYLQQLVKEGRIVRVRRGVYRQAKPS